MTLRRRTSAGVARRIAIGETVPGGRLPEGAWYNGAVADGVIIETVPARAALAGNPSDGYGGAVLATPVRSAAATVTLRPSDRYEVGDRWFAGWDELAAAPPGDEAIGQAELVLAGIRAYAAIVSPEPFAPCSIDIDTSIPRSVGLAGSSAIVIAAIRAVARCAGHEPLRPDALAVVALAAESEHLGIAAGLQDRLVQSADAVVHMEFDADSAPRRFDRPSGRCEVLAAGLPGELFVAHRTEAAASSDTTHRPLRERHDAGDLDVIRAMTALADEARAATAALRAGDVAGLGEAMDRSFDLRRSVLPLNPAHVEMVHRARLAGAAANFSGSGGAITVLAADEATGRRARAALSAIGCRFLPVTS